PADRDNARDERERAETDQGPRPGRVLLVDLQAEREHSEQSDVADDHAPRFVAEPGCREEEQNEAASAERKRADRSCTALGKKLLSRRVEVDHSETKVRERASGANRSLLWRFRAGASERLAASFIAGSRGSWRGRWR